MHIYIYMYIERERDVVTYMSMSIKCYGLRTLA